MVKLNKYTLRKMRQKRNPIGKKSKVIHLRYVLGRLKELGISMWVILIIFKVNGCQ